MPRSELLPGTLIADRYRVGRELGRGGMGIVLHAVHTALGTPVALKVLYGAAAHEGELVARFLQEARAAASLRSEFVARVTDFGTLDDESPFMVLEYLEGEDLASRLTRGMPARDLVDAIIQACAGLAEAHAHGIVHRDLKPSNLFLTRRPDGSPCVKVLDFGISKLTKGPSASEDAITTGRAMLGTPMYMSPEHVRSAKSVDARTDVWSLGVILYEGLAGAPPFGGRSVGEVFVGILERDPAPITGADADLAAVVFGCLARDPSDRVPDVATLAHALEPFASSEGRAAATRARSTAEAVAAATTNEPEAAALAIGAITMLAPTLGASVLSPRTATVAARSSAAPPIDDERRPRAADGGKPGLGRITGGGRRAYPIALGVAAAALATALGWSALRAPTAPPNGGAEPTPLAVIPAGAVADAASSAAASASPQVAPVASASSASSATPPVASAAVSSPRRAAARPTGAPSAAPAATPSAPARPTLR